MKKVFLVGLAVVVAVVTATHCDGRGGCDCDCSWANPKTCHNDDGSCCWGCCCSTTPTPGPPTPPSPTPPDQKVYCPAANDLTVAYSVPPDTPQLYNQGWSIHGGGAVATKSSFNLLGGYVEYDIDFSGTHTGVNGNVYTISPKFNTSAFHQNIYCDGAKTGSDWCLEVDWIESNGNCGGATTLHTVEGPGSNGCSAWGCRNSYHYNNQSSFHMRVEFAMDGTWNTIRNGQTITPNSLSPIPGANDWMVLRSFYSKLGAVVYSSQWTGWVPVDDCGSNGDLGSSTFTVKNLKIAGAVVQGSAPRLCNNGTYPDSITL